MLALIREKGNCVVLREAPTPRLTGSTEVMVRVRSAAVCATDLAIVSGAFGGTTPRVIGHEVAGEVIEIGSGVKSFRPGNRVVLQPTIYCGLCPSCREGNWHLCPNRNFIGLDVDGGLAETTVVPEANLALIPDRISFQHACLVEPLACVIHALERFGRKPEKGVIITGAGFSAFLFAQMLISRGIPPEKILVTGRRSGRLAIIRQLGVHVLDVREKTLEAAATQIFGENQPDLLIDQTGDPVLLRQSLDTIAPNGTLFIYDFLRQEILFHFGALQLREITIKTSTGCPGTILAALSAMETGAVDMSPAITNIYSPSEMLAAYQILETKDAHHMKSVVVFDS